MHLAQLNVARLLYLHDDPRVAEFMDNLDLVNGLAERAPGFVWRYADESGAATQTRAFDDPDVILNMSVWECAEALEHFVFKTVHHKFYARRHNWFDAAFGPALVMWWLPAGTTPTVEEALSRYENFKSDGPSPDAFGWEGLAQVNLWKTARCA